MVHVTTLAKFAHQLRLEAFVLQDAFITRGHDQPLHADGAVLKEPTMDFHTQSGHQMVRGVKLGMGIKPFNLHMCLTSSGTTLIFSVYLLTTSSGFFPSHGNKSRKKSKLACLDLNGNDRFLHAPLRPKPSLIIPVCSQAGMATGTHSFKPLIRLRTNPDYLFI